MTDRAKFDLHAQITDRIVQAIENGPGEFVMPWHRGAASGAPRNAVTHRSYRGINVVSLWVVAKVAGYETAQWVTFKQWQERGAQVRKGEKGTLIVFYKMLDRADAEAERDEAEEGGRSRTMIAKPSWVFNVAQVDGFVPDAIPDRPNTAIEPLEAAERAILASGADIRYAGSRAYYNRLTDHIRFRRLAISLDLRPVHREKLLQHYPP